MSSPQYGHPEPQHRPLGRDFLVRRNALWATLRGLEPGSVPFEATLSELSALIGWNRVRILAGLGLSELGLSEQSLAEVEARPDQSQ